MSALNFEIRKSFFKSWKTELSNATIDDYIKILEQELNHIQPYVTGGFFIHDFRESKCIYASGKISELTGKLAVNYIGVGSERCFNHIHPDDLPFVMKFQKTAHDYVFNIPREQKSTVEICCVFRVVNENNKEGQWCYSKTIPVVFGNKGEIQIGYEFIDPLQYPYNIGLWWRVSFWDLDNKEYFIDSGLQNDKVKLESVLTKTEKRVSELLLLNKTSQGIADELHISKHTVDTHRRNIKRKLESSSNEDFIKKLTKKLDE